MSVEFRPIPGFPGYQVGSDGSIRSCRVPKSGVLRETWKVLKPAPDPQTGYRRVSLRRDGKTIRKYVHSVVLETFTVPRPPGMECCHNDGDRSNNRLENLRWDTASANQTDRVEHGTSNRGSRQGQSRLTEEEIPEIFALRREIPNVTMEDLAIYFGVSKSAIANVLYGYTWGWLTTKLGLLPTS